MQKWQHMFIDVSPLTQTANPDRMETVQRIRAHGENGWELVTLLQDQGILWAAFKRPLEEQAAPAPTPVAARPAPGRPGEQR